MVSGWWLMGKEERNWFGWVGPIRSSFETSGRLYNDGDDGLSSLYLKVGVLCVDIKTWQGGGLAHLVDRRMRENKTFKAMNFWVKLQLFAYIVLHYAI